MTSIQAHRAFSRPLVFGDAEQIAAVQFLADVAAARASIEACDEGHRNIDYVIAGFNQSGVAHAMALCDCAEGFTDEVLRKVLADERRAQRRERDAYRKYLRGEGPRPV